METKTQSTSAKKVNTKNAKLIRLYFEKLNANNGKHNDPKSTGK